MGKKTGRRKTKGEGDANGNQEGKKMCKITSRGKIEAKYWDCKEEVRGKEGELKERKCNCRP